MPAHRVSVRQPSDKRGAFVIGLGPEHEMPVIIPVIGHYTAGQDPRWFPLVGFTKHSLGPIIELESVSITKSAAHWVAGGRDLIIAYAVLLGTLRKTRSQSEAGVWRGRPGHRRAAQASELGESGVVGRTTANSSLPAERATNRITRSSRRSPLGKLLGFMDQAWGQREPANQGTGRFNSPHD